MIGLDLKTYWDIDPKTFKKYVDVYIKKEKSRIKEQDQNNYNLGLYLRIAFNDPNKYPKKAFLNGIKIDKPKLSEAMSDEEMLKMMKRNNRLLGGTFIK